MDEAESAIPHSEPPYLLAFVFCKDVIAEGEPRFMSPFRISEGIEIALPTPGANQVWLVQNIETNLFVGISCYGSDDTHRHEIFVKGYRPNGELALSVDVGLSDFTSSGRALYTSMAIDFPPNVWGRYRFEAWIDGVFTAASYFTVKHRPIAGTPALES